jgi:hypothetical protein
MPSELPGPDNAGSSAWPGISRLAAQAAQVLEVSGRIADSSGDRSGEGSGADGDDDRASLQDELGGLRAAIDYVIGRNGLDWNAINRERDRKRALYERR